NPGSGADDVVYSMNLQADLKIIIAGRFKHYNQTRRIAIARLFTDGTLDTSFMDNAYNHFAGLPTHYFDPATEPPNVVFASALQPDGNFIISGSFSRVGGGAIRNLPGCFAGSPAPAGARDAVSFRNNLARLIGGSTPGPGNFELARDTYTSDENGGSYFVTLLRTNGNLGQASATISPKPLPPGPGSAVEGVDFSFSATNYANPTYLASWPPPPWSWEIQDGTFGQNQGFSDTVVPGTSLGYPQNDVWITNIDNNLLDGNRMFNLDLTDPKGAVESSFQSLLQQFLTSALGPAPGLGGENIPTGVALGRSLAQMTIVDD